MISKGVGEGCVYVPWCAVCYVFAGTPARFIFFKAQFTDVFSHWWGRNNQQPSVSCRSAVAGRTNVSV